MAKLPIPFGNPMTYTGHSGIDYPQPQGTPFRASAPGVVTWLGHNRAGGYFIWVQYDGGPKVGYHHMPSHAGCPREGARFKAGDRLGYVGNTGNSTGPHLHSEVEGHRTTAGYWKFFDRNRVIGSGSGSSVSGKLVEDGKLGPATIRTMQSVLGVTQDGIWGSGTTRALQKKLVAVGHKIAADGELGPATIRAMQVFLLGAKNADGKMGPITIRGLQHYLNAGGKFTIDRPSDPGKLTVDGKLGPLTIKAMQKAFGVTQDGNWGSETTKAIQRHFGVTVDGKLGPVTVKAYQRSLGVPADGEIGPVTIKAIQTWLNKGGRLERVPEPTKPNKVALPKPTPRKVTWAGAKKAITPPYAYRIKDGKPNVRPGGITHVAIHHTGSTADQEAYFLSENDRVSAPSLLITAKAEAVEFVPYHLKPTSTGAIDDKAVAIETQNVSGKPAWGISDAQHEKIAQFIAWLSQQTSLGGVAANVPLDREHIIGHREVATNGTICPGPSMDLDRIVARAIELAASDSGSDTVPVDRSWLQSVFDRLKNLLGVAS